MKQWITEDWRAWISRSAVATAMLLIGYALGVYTVEHR